MARAVYTQLVPKEACRLREIRKSKGMTQEDVAFAIGSSDPKHYARVENGGNAELRTLFKIMDVLECTFKDIYGR